MTTLSRRSMFAGSASITFHAALLALALVLVGVRAANPPPPEPTPVELLDLSLAPLGTGQTLGTASGTGQTTLTGAPVKHGSAPAAKRAIARAAPVRDPYADVVMGYDKPTDAETGAAIGTGTGTGLAELGAGLGAGTGFGDDGDGPGLGTGIPEPPQSQAHPPRPKRPYRTWELPAVKQFVGQTVTVKLDIDPQGVVRKVIVLQGVTPSLDQQASDIARSFAFFPAQFANGTPRWGMFRWDFRIVENKPPKMKKAERYSPFSLFSRDPDTGKQPPE